MYMEARIRIIKENRNKLNEKILKIQDKIDQQNIKKLIQAQATNKQYENICKIKNNLN